MSNQARISSIDALEALRAELIRYIEKTRVALESMTGEARRTHTWLDVERSQYWAAQLRKLTKQLDQAEEELYSANLISPLASNSLHKMAVARARRNLELAQAKMQVVKHWCQTYDKHTTPLLHQLEPLFFHVGQRLPKAVHSLDESIKALQAYTESPCPAHAPLPAEPPAPPPPEVMP